MVENCSGAGAGKKREGAAVGVGEEADCVRAGGVAVEARVYGECRV